MQTRLRRRNCNEVLLGNRIENEFKKMMFPLNAIQQFTFAQKYRIRDNFITSNSNTTLFIDFCGLICIIAYSWYQNMTTDVDKTQWKATEIAAFAMDLFFEPIVLLINFACTVRYTNTHVILFLKVQRLAKFTKYSEYKGFTIFNWLAVVWFVTWHVIFVILIYVNYNIFLWSMVTQLLINSQILYTSRFVYLLRRNLVLWTDNIIKFGDSVRTKTDRIHESRICEELFNYFKDILEAFSILKRTFEFMVR